MTDFFLIWEEKRFQNNPEESARTRKGTGKIIMVTPKKPKQLL